MPLVYVDCQSGISGDMFLGALLDAGLPLELLNQRIALLGIPDLRFEVAEVRRRGLRATKLNVVFTPENRHRHLKDIVRIIDESQLAEIEKQWAKKIFECLAEAEAKVHGCDIQKVHFHEVGAIDSIADIVGVAIGLNHFGIEGCSFSAIPVGGGFIEISHGRVGVPAPATAELLRGVPIAASDVASELTTPTGAAIVRVLSQSFGGMPAMTISALGCGAGSRDFAQQANILRLFLGEVSTTNLRETIAIMETNVDDVSAEIVADCCERLRQAGALDVYTTSIGMKKNRPGTKITVLCRPEVKEELQTLLFIHSHTLGVRSWNVDRVALARQTVAVDTAWGSILGTVSSDPQGQIHFVPEFESCRRAAEENSAAVIDVFAAARAEFLRTSQRE